MNYRTPLLMIIIGEALALIVTCVSMCLRVATVSGFGWLSFLSLIGLIVEFIGIICLRNENNEFDNAFKALIAELVFALTSSIVLVVGANQPNAAWVTPVSSVCSLLSMVASIYLIYSIFRGCKVIVDGYSNSSFLELQLRIYIAAVAVNFLSSLFLSLNVIASNRAAFIVFGVLSIAASVTASITFIYSLIKTRQELA